VGIPGYRELPGNLKYVPILNANRPIGINLDERKEDNAYGEKQKVPLSFTPGILAKRNHHEPLS